MKYLIKAKKNFNTYIQVKDVTGRVFGYLNANGQVNFAIVWHENNNACFLANRFKKDAEKVDCILIVGTII